MAERHAEDLGTRGALTHEGSDGSNLDARISKVATTYVKTAESISHSAYNGGEAVLMTLLSDDLPLSVKDNFYDPVLRRVGICNHDHKEKNFVTVFVFAGEVFRRGDIDKIA